MIGVFIALAILVVIVCVLIRVSIIRATIKQPHVDLDNGTCATCKMRYHMNKEDISRTENPGSHYRCSLDGCIIPSLDRWCPMYKPEQDET